MIQCGIDRIREYDRVFRGKRLGLITSASGVDRRLTSTVDRLAESYGLTALFSPEHGLRGNVEAGGNVDTYRDPDTGVMVYSLYGQAGRKLSPERLREVDAVVYDIQDLGVRYYTFISTMYYAMQSCSEAGKELIILDRPDPLGGLAVEGNVVEPGYESFVGVYSLCMRYGLTVGELAAMMHKEGNYTCPLTVIPVSGWKRSMLHPETDLVWMMPSPNIPKFESALVYSGTCLFEGTNLSEGRGTTAPFEIIGAPFVDGRVLAKAMNGKKLPGVLFSPAYFTPTASKHQGIACQGVHIHVTDPRAFLAADTGVELLFEIKNRWPEEFQFLSTTPEWGRPFSQVLFGGPEIMEEGMTAEKIREKFSQDSQAFAKRMEAYQLYD